MFRDLKLGTKQIIAFGIVLLMVAAVRYYVFHRMRDIQSDIEEITVNWLPRALAIADIHHKISELRRVQLQHAFVSDDETRDQLNMTTIGLLDEINANLDPYVELMKSPENQHLFSQQELEVFDQFERTWDIYLELSLQFFQLSSEHHERDALTLLNGEAQTAFNALSPHLEELVEISREGSQRAAARADATFISIRRVTATLFIITVVLSIFIAAALVRFVTVPVQQLEKAAGRVAEGDLNVSLKTLGRDEIGNLARSFNQMTRALREAEKKTRQQAERLKHKNKELQSAMSELRNTQEQLLVKEKLASLGDLVAVVAHEINNPIGTINSSTDVCERCRRRLEKAIAESDSIEAIRASNELQKAMRLLKSNIAVTLTAGRRIEKIVKSLRNFAHLDEAEFQRVDIHEGIESSLTLMGSDLYNHIDIVRQYGNIPQIGCYPSRLNQVFINILKNSVHAIKEKQGQKGRKSENGVINIKSSREDGYVQVEIADNGAGIPPERLHRIFDFSFTSNDLRVRMGSGLSTAYKIVQEHNGEITIDSKLGKGTTVHITLPIT